MLGFLFFVAFLSVSFSGGKGGSSSKHNHDDIYEINQLVLTLEYGLDDIELGIQTLDEVKATITPLFDDDFSYIDNVNGVTMDKLEFIDAYTGLTVTFRSYHYHSSGGLLFLELSDTEAIATENRLRIFTKEINDNSFVVKRCRQGYALEALDWKFVKVSGEWKYKTLTRLTAHEPSSPDSREKCCD